MARFGDRLRELRQEKGWRQGDLAKRLGLAQTTIANYERGLRFPGERLVIAIADQLDVSLDYLLGRTDHELPRAGRTAHEPAQLSRQAQEYLDLLVAGNGDRAAAGLLGMVALKKPDPAWLYLGRFSGELAEVQMATGRMLIRGAPKPTLPAALAIHGRILGMEGLARAGQPIPGLTW